MEDHLNRDGDPILSKEMRIEKGTDEDTENLLLVTLEPEETESWEGKYIYQVTVRDGAGNVDVPSQGVLYVYKNIDEGFIGG